jgi:mediator of RNA polymerase II transcription subunit 14
LRDINSFAIAGRAPRFYYTARAVNDQPDRMVEFLSVLRTKTILDLAEEKARYLGYQSYKTRNFRPLGNEVPGCIE